jgi:DNA-binding transcriptional MerR regulator
MPNQRSFSPAMISSLFDINKSTLLRWEREGVLPPVQRDLSSRQGERAYNQADIRAIMHLQRAQLQRQISQISRAGEKQLELHPAIDENDGVHRSLREVLETNSLHKFLAGDPTGLIELREHKELTPTTIARLVRVALELFDPSDPTFAQIMEVAAKQSPKLSAGQS